MRFRGHLMRFRRTAHFLIDALRFRNIARPSTCQHIAAESSFPRWLIGYTARPTATRDDWVKRITAATTSDRLRRRTSADRRHNEQPSRHTCSSSSELTQQPRAW